MRGLRGPMSTRNPYTGSAAPLRRRLSAADYFLDCVEDSVRRIGKSCPQALAGVAVGVEEVPRLTDAYTDERVPLAAAIERTETSGAQVVVYRRPLERRAASRRGLGILVHRTIVGQLSALSGLPAEQIDPDAPDEDDD